MASRRVRTPGNDEWDPRNNRAVVIPGYLLESLSGLPKHKIGPATSITEEAIEFQDDDALSWAKRFVAFDAANEGKRAELVGKIAQRDEALKQAEAENVRQSKQEQV